MILEALRLYDADRTGKFDYALETAGGSIPHALCSETYTPSASTVQLFGYTVWQYSNSARTVIQVGVWRGCSGWSGALRCLWPACSLVLPACPPGAAWRSPWPVLGVPRRSRLRRHQGEGCGWSRPLATWGYPALLTHLQLATSISLTEVTVEHLPRSLSPTGKIDSAPKNFSLYVSV